MTTSPQKEKYNVQKNQPTLRNLTNNRKNKKNTPSIGNGHRQKNTRRHPTKRKNINEEKYPLTIKKYISVMKKKRRPYNNIPRHLFTKEAKKLLFVEKRKAKEPLTIFIINKIEKHFY